MTRKRQSILHNPNIQGLLVLVVIMGLGVFVLLQNRQPTQRFARPLAASATQSSEPAWRSIIGTEVHDIHEPTPTVPTPTNEYIAPTAAFSIDLTPQMLAVTQIQSNALPSLTPIPTNFLTATIEFRSESTPIPSPTGFFVAGAFDEEGISNFQPPAAEPPIALQPNDHFWFRRPVYANANSRSIFYYPYGGRWPGNASTVHHGVDMPNPVGELVLAGTNGTVVFAGITDQDYRIGDTEIYVSYGNFVIIESDQTWQGQPVWILYAHMSAILVEQGTHVKIGDRIGLVGETGLVTGAHVHFEVRIGKNNYASTRNPLLWIAPFVGHGVLAGSVVDAKGEFIEDVNLTLYQGGRVVDRSVTYARNELNGRRYLHVNPDDNWQENFAFADVPAGQYQLVAIVQGRRMQRTVTINPLIVNFVTFEVNPPESTPIPSP